MVRYELIAMLVGGEKPVKDLVNFWQLTAEEAAFLRAGRKERDDNKRQAKLCH